MWLISIDPGLVSSGTGIAIFNNGSLFTTSYCPPVKSKSLRDRVMPIVRILKAATKRGEYEMVVEKSFYPGKANILHLKTLGVLEYHFPEIKFIAPTTVKKQITGHGRSDKSEVKKELLNRYPKKPYASAHDAINWDNEDVVDAVAIGLAYLEMKDA